MEKPKAVKMKYSDIKSFDFSQLCAKLSNTPTTNVRANHIRHIVKECNKAGDKITEEFKTELVEKFAKRDEEGKIIRPPDQGPMGFEVPEEKQDEFIKAQEEFGNREAEINWRPLTPDTLADIKLTARELDLLGDLFVEENGPGVPHLSVQR